MNQHVLVELMFLNLDVDPGPGKRQTKEGQEMKGAEVGQGKKEVEVKQEKKGTSDKVRLMYLRVGGQAWKQIGVTGEEVEVVVEVGVENIEVDMKAGQVIIEVEKARSGVVVLKRER